MLTDLWGSCPGGTKLRTTLESAFPAQGIRAILPVLLARGPEAGPSLLVVAGQHGRELHGIAAIARVFASLDPAMLRGRVAFLPILNPPAVQMRRQDYPDESQRYCSRVPVSWNMNRNWGQGLPSHPGGITTMVWEQFGRHADAIVDLHGWESQSAAWANPEHRELLLAFGLAANMLLAAEHHIPGMLLWQATQSRIPALTVELAPQNTLLSAVVETGERGILNLMRHLNMLAGTPQRPAVQYLLGGSSAEEALVMAPAAGLCEPLVEQGSVVAAGQPLARLWDLATMAETATITAPIAGHVFNLLRLPSGEDQPASAVVAAGQTIGLLKTVLETIHL